MPAGRSKHRSPIPRNPRAKESPSLLYRHPLSLPLCLTILLFALSFTPRVHATPILSQSFLGAVMALLAWQGALKLKETRRQQTVSLETNLRPQHYVQALVQLSVFAYWGWYWRPVYDHSTLLLAQVVFAYIFDMLLTWSRRERYVLGFGPFPIILSTNLFLWFRDDWFYLQFLMIAVGFLGKEFVRWNREGRRVHIFNPSAFSLGLFSLVLLTTGMTPITWGEEIATTLTLAPSIYLFLFLAGLVVMYAFSITLIVASAAAVLFGLSALYTTTTGVPYFIDSEIPSAVFLGLHLLVTDPSTSPRTPIGKTVFGILYGATVFGLYAVLGGLGVPTFYDKLLSVPLLNLSVQAIDRLVQALSTRPIFDRFATAFARPSANLTHIAVWIIFFTMMALAGATDGRHRGDSVPFWEDACENGRRQACERLLQVEASYCADASAWACNELGLHYRNGQVVEPDRELALGYFSRACELRFQAACFNILESENRYRADPKLLDLRLLLREGGANLMGMAEPAIYARACDHEWTFACRR